MAITSSTQAKRLAVMERASEPFRPVRNGFLLLISVTCLSLLKIYNTILSGVCEQGINREKFFSFQLGRFIPPVYKNGENVI